MTDASAICPDATSQPVVYIPHGAGPCFFMDWTPAETWDEMAAFLRSLAATLPSLPRAILMVSAHWLTPEFSVTAGPRPGLIYDYHGFPPHTYALEYPAPGAPDLARRIGELMKTGGISGHQDPQRGFDHGMFIPLKLMFPEADIPVVQLSLRADLDPAAHVQLGQVLAPLRDEGVLIIGSGMSFHNMRGYGDSRFTRPSEEFDRWLTTTVALEPGQRNAALCDWTHAPRARECHLPGQEEHLIPLMVVAGAALQDHGRQVYSQRVLETQLSAFRFG